MDQSVAVAAQRHLVELEKRIASQAALVEQLTATNRDATQAKRTLRVLEQALALTKEHLVFVLRDDTYTHPALVLAGE